MPTMIAARLHAYGQPMTLDRIEVPQPRPTDMLVEVKACGGGANLARVISNFFGTLTPDNKMMPPLPAIFGLDPAGVVAKVGEQVFNVRPGERVYVNPGRSCGSCRMCRSGHDYDCPGWTLQGYFGRSQEIMRRLSLRGASQFITAPATAPGQAARQFELRGRRALRLSRHRLCGDEENRRRSGTGAPDQRHQRPARAERRATGAGHGGNKNSRHRPQSNIARSVKALAPARIDVVSVPNARRNLPANADPLVAWAKKLTEGHGVDGMIDCLPPGAPGSAMLRALFCLRRGGRAVNVGAVMETLPINAFWMMTNRIGLQGSVWFTTGEGEDMAAMAAAGTLDLSILEHRVSPLFKVNEVLAGMDDRNGGFTNFVIDPTRVH